MNAVKLQLPSSIRIHLVVNVSQVVQYREQIKGQKKEERKPVKVEGVEEWKVEKILNKKKIRGVEKYLGINKRMEFPGKYTVKLLYGWDNKKI